MQVHGLLYENGDEKVCPGDYIVTNHKGNRYKLKAKEFEELYELYEPEAHSVLRNFE